MADKIIRDLDTAAALAGTEYFVIDDGTTTAKRVALSAVSTFVKLGVITSFTVADANGISGSVSVGSTPIITLSLGDITPTSVTAQDAIRSNTAFILQETSLTPIDLITIVAPFNITDSYTITLPQDAGTAGYLWTTDGAGAMSWTNPTSIVPTSITVANEAVDTTCFIAFFGGATGNQSPKTHANMTFNAATGVVTLASSILSSTDINGGTIDGTTIGASSATTIAGTAITGTTFNGLTLTTSTGVFTLTNGKTFSVSNSITLAGTDGKGIDVGAATSGKFLIGNGTNMVLSTSTIPTSAGTAGKILVSDGTNYVSSTPTFPNTSATSGKMIKSDGTNRVASTETYAAPGTSGNVLTSDGTNWTSATPAASASFWTAITATRVSNTTCTVAGDQTAIFKKGMVLKRQESGVDNMAMVSIPSTVSGTTTITFIGDTMAATPDAGTFKYMGMDAFIVNFAIAGTIGATGTNLANAWYANEPYRVLGADLYTGTAGTTNSTTIDINKGGTTMFTTKPTLATTVAASTTPFTADDTTALALNDKVTIDVDAVQTTAAIDLYVKLYLVPTRYLFLT